MKTKTISQREARAMRKQLAALRNFPYAEKFDEIMSKHFGIEFDTVYSLTGMAFVTERVDGKPMTNTMFKVAESVASALVAYRDVVTP